MLIPLPVTTMTSKTAKAMLPPSYHPSSKPWSFQIKIKLKSSRKNIHYNRMKKEIAKKPRAVKT
jgi:hypothetical protein